MAECISRPVGCSSHLNLTDSSDCIEVRHCHNGLIPQTILDSSRDSRNVYFTKLETSLYLAQLFFHARFKAETIPPNFIGLPPMHVNKLETKTPLRQNILF